MPKGKEGTKRDVGARNIPNVCSRGHPALVQIQENLAPYSSRQNLAVSWKMRTMQRRSPRNKTPIKKKIKKRHCLPASAQLKGTCVLVCVKINCVYMCVVLYVGYMAQSASQFSRSENQIQENPAAIWEAHTISDTMYANTSHTEGLLVGV